MTRWPPWTPPASPTPAEEDRDAREQVLAAAEGCPVEAITLTLVGSGELVFPPEE